MITKIENGQYPYQYLCTSEDIFNLPNDAPIGSLAYELDTSTMYYAYYYDGYGSTWIQVGTEPPEPPDDGGDDDGGDDGDGGVV